MSDIRVTVFGKTDLGRTRDHNEDTFLVADLSNARANLLPDVRDHVVGERGSLFMVADGMGGAAAGEVASQMAAAIIYRHLLENWIHDPEPSPTQFARHVREAVERANQEIHAYALEHPDVRGMGTTLTAAGVFGGDLFLAQIGDSRAYLIRGGRGFQVTKDQSLTQRLVDAGELTEEEAESSMRRNIILQALGPDPRVKVVLTSQRVSRGDVLVVCSDGLSGLVKKDEIATIVSEETDLQRVCTRLVDLANERGGPDNITVIAARFEGEGLPLPTEVEEPSHKVYRLPGSASTSDEHATTLPPAPVLPPPVPAAAPPPVVEAVPESRPNSRGVVYSIVLLAAAILVWYLLRS